MTDREAFCATLWTGPLVRGDAIVVLCGEDADVRINTGMDLFAKGGAPRLVLSGGKDGPPRWLSAARILGRVFEHGLAPDRVITEDGSQNTREQAVNVLKMALECRWETLLLVASAYHLPRAFLTFVRAIAECEAASRIRVVPVPTARCSWWAAPAGIDLNRLALMEMEFEKIEAYREHVAAYIEGLEYLKRWEGA